MVLSLALSVCLSCLHVFIDTAYIAYLSVSCATTLYNDLLYSRVDRSNTISTKAYRVCRYMGILLPILYKLSDATTLGKSISLGLIAL